MDRVEQFWVLAASSPNTLGNYILETWCWPTMSEYTSQNSPLTAQECDGDLSGTKECPQAELQGLYRWLKDLAYYAGGAYAESLTSVDQALTEFAKTDKNAQKFVLAATGWAQMEDRVFFDTTRSQPLC